jgi:two-component sensor histidine kinase/CHASE3 domain sensor protein
LCDFENPGIWLKAMSIAGRSVVLSSIGLLAVGLLTLLGIVGTTVWLNERAQIYSRDVIHARDTRGSAVELRTALQAAESSQRGFVATANEIYLAPYGTAKAAATLQLDKLTRALAAYPETARMLQRLSTIITEKIAEMDQSISLKTDLKDAEALALLRTNRGKALMDEANVFLSGIIQATEERLTAGVDEQQRNAALLRWISIIGAIVIVLVVAGTTLTLFSYAREVAQARDEVRALNASLETRVEQRTADLVRARDRAEVLLKEVNHRVANSLSIVSSMVKLQSNAVTDRSAKQALGETQGRILAIALVHKRLYNSGDVRVVALDEYLKSLLEQLETTMRSEGHGASLRCEFQPVSLPTDETINLGVVATEWVTNAFKYAYPGRPGEIRVRLQQLPDRRVELVVEDDGVGRKDTNVIKGTGLGTRIVSAMANTMGAQVEYRERQPGLAATLTFSNDD